VSQNLLIVESPAKSKTITKYLEGHLGQTWVVLASYGHIRDLRRKEGAVDVTNDFEMHYEIVERNQRNVDALVREAKKAKTIWLATDLDREGEAISWHITEVLKDKGLLDGKTIHRVAFSEITPKAIQAAVANPRQLSYPMVYAQQARRALDYLVGFTLSPVLWRKVHKGLSAGRVQSPALRMIVERDEEIERFDPKEYWTVGADMSHRKGAFAVRLTKLHGKRFEQFDLVNEDQAIEARTELANAAGKYLTVSDVASKERHRRPAPPFTTSTLQQEAARKLGFSTTRTMKAAQQLYEGIHIGNEGQIGLITYMRTDATALGEDAVSDIRSMIKKEYGERFLPGAPQIYKTKSKNAQEAHEAIRPSSALRTPPSLAKYLDKDQYRLYDLIWKRTVACQMTEALLNTVSVEFALPTPKGDASFRATGTTVVFAGFLVVYEEGNDNVGKSDEDKEKDARLPQMTVGEQVPLDEVTIDQHFTEPPPYFTEAAVVKTMEELGIGRPSTYAAIIQVLLNREYVTLDGKKFIPTDIGRAVSHFLTEHFAQYVDYNFTAKLEDDLDAVARDEEQWIPLMHKFWTPFKALVDEKNVSVDRSSAMGARNLGTDPVSGKPVGVRLGKFGPVAFIGDHENKEEKLRFASLSDGLTMHAITLEQALELFKLPRDLGDGVMANTGRFGPYVKQGETIASLGEGESAFTITYEEALAKIVEKRELIANRIIQDFGDGLQVLNGQFGPYICQTTDTGRTNAHCPKGKEPKDLTKEECLKAIAEAPPRKPKGGKFKKGGKPAPGGKKPFKKKG
jgi:DNA topoisomerase-1